MENRRKKSRYVWGCILVAIIVFSSFVSHSLPKYKLIFPFLPSMYFKIVDQDGDPIEGVNVRLTHGRNSWVYSNLAEGIYSSDEAGYIRVRMDGRGFTVKDIEKRGYRINFSQQFYNYTKANSKNWRSKFQFENFDRKNFSYDEPFIVKAWRVDDIEHSSKCYQAKARLKIKTDGSAYTLNLIGLAPGRDSKWVAETSPKLMLRQGRFDGGVVISFQRNEQEQAIGLSDREIRKRNLLNPWSFKVEVLGGGVQETTGLYNKIAPNSGYSEIWNLDNTTFKAWGGPRGSSSESDIRTLFIKEKSGLYSLLRLEIEPTGRHSDNFKYARLNIEASQNMDGGNNLLELTEIGRGAKRRREQEGACADTEADFLREFGLL